MPSMLTMTRRGNEMNLPVLWYFADPMCSWCWGFSPVIEALRDEYRPRLRIALVLGGLRPGETAPLTPASREEILHHWHMVHARTGQAFRFDNAMPDGFVYDTEPPSRAVLTVGGMAPDSIFAMFKAIQSAFYAAGRDVTRGEILADLAGELGVAREPFLAAFASDEARAKTRAHFKQARQAGVHGFPTLILQKAERLHRIADGWQPLAAARAAIEAGLAR